MTKYIYLGGAVCR